VARPLDVAVVGIGWFGELHVSALTGLPDARVVAVCDTNEARAREVAGRFGVPKVYPTIEELLRAGGLEAATLVTDPANHYLPAMRLLEAGVPLFVEKPLAVQPAQAEAIVEAAERRRLPLMVGHILRFDPRYRGVADALAGGRMGRLISVTSRRLNAARLFVQGYRLDPILRAGVHDIDLGLWYTGARAEQATSVRAVRRHVRGHELPDAYWALVEFESGAVFSLEIGFVLPEGSAGLITSHLTVVGTRAMAEITHPARDTAHWTAEGLVNPDSHFWPSAGRHVTGALRDELAHFVAAVRDGRPVEAGTPAQALDALRLCHRIMDAARGGSG
jgi:UDP-N-acetylglucosamine 3-dehydrogenase